MTIVDKNEQKIGEEETFVKTSATADEIIEKWEANNFEFNNLPKNEDGHYVTQICCPETQTVYAEKIQKDNSKWRLQPEMSELFPEECDYVEHAELIGELFNEWLALSNGYNNKSQPDRTNHTKTKSAALIGLVEHCMELSEKFPNQDQRFERHLQIKARFKGNDSVYGISFYGNGLWVYEKSYDLETDTENFTKRTMIGSTNQVAWRNNQNVWFWSQNMNDWMTTARKNRDGSTKTKAEMLEELSDYLPMKIMTMFSE